MNNQRYFFWYILLVVCIIALDQCSKYSMLMNGVSYTITSFLTLDVQLNRGISWGMFHSESDIFFYFITFLITCFVGGFLYHTCVRFQEGHAIFPECMVVAGACSNLFDRFMHGGVIDFILLSWGKWSFPLFNCADVAIVLGVFFILIEGLQEQ